MDVEPIYCAEQIVVPPDLTDILKAYTKAVIKRQPEDIIEFSAKYFANLADVSASAQGSPAPTKDQLRLVYSRTGSGGVLTYSQLSALCQQAGIAESVAAKVAEAGKFSPDAVPVDKFIFLMLAMSSQDFNRLASAMFDVFTDNSKLETAKFCDLVSYLGPEMDSAVTPKFMADLRSDVAEFPELTYVDICQAPSLRLKLGLI